LVKIGERFGPDRALASLYYVYLAIPAIPSFMLVSIVGVFVFKYVRSLIGLIAWITSFAITLAIILPIAFWIEKYVESISFTLERERVVFERGVWWRRKSFVPYNRITNVDVIQGPISRAFGLGSVMIQTAGYSATAGSQGSAFAESSIFGVRNFEEIKDIVLGLISKPRPIAAEAAIEQEGDVNVQILQELKKIRERLETR